MQSRRVYLRSVPGIGVSAVFLYLAMRQVHWREAFNAVAQCDVRLLLAGLAFAGLTYGLFAVRWRVLLAAADELPVATAFSYVMIGYLANTVLPLRLGDVTRAALFGRKRQVSASLVLGSIVLERLLDISVILVLALALSLVIQFTPVVRLSIRLFAGGALGALVLLTLLVYHHQHLPGLVARLPRFVPRRPVDYALGLTERFAQGGQALRNFRQLVTAVGFSLLAWASAGLWTICYVRAFHIPGPWYAGLWVLAMVNLGGAIPSSPGAIGVYHWLAMQSLSHWVPDTNVTAAYAIATHALNIALIIGLGGWTLVRENLSLVRLRRMTDEGE